jgi:serine/threonine-protein kinase
VDVGERVGGYEVMEVVARDGARVACVARPPWQPGRLARVALDVVAIGQEAAFTAMAVDELALSCAVRHANLQRLYDVGRDGDRAYVATELLDGARADELAALPHLPLRAAVAVGAAVCAALDHLHGLVNARGSLDWVYRDVSPAATHVGCDGAVRLAYPGQRPWPTPRGPVALRHLAPEQVRGLRVDTRTDVFHAGALVWELVAGRPRFAADTPDEQVLTRTIREPMLRLSSVRYDVPLALDNAIARAVALDPGARGTIGNLADALQAVGPATARELAGVVRAAFPDRARRFATLR